MERVLAYFIGLVLLCDVAVVTVHVLDDNTDLIRGRRGTTVTVPPQVRVVPREGQVFLTGDIDELAADDAQIDPLPTPFTMSAIARGAARVTIDQALMSGRRVSISWDSGTPLPISGAGGIDLGATHVEVAGGMILWEIDGAPRKFLPGTYRLGAAVAVGTAGLATPREGVEFTADDQTVVNARGRVVVRQEIRRVELLGPGKMSAKGRLNVQFPDRSRQASSVTFGEGPFRVTLERKDGKLTVDALLQDPVEVG